MKLFQKKRIKNPLTKEMLKAAPHTTLNWELYRKKRQKKRIIIATIFVIIGGIWSYFHIQKVQAESQLIHTVVATEQITQGQKITEENLKMKTYEAHELPEGFQTNITDVTGLFATQDIPQNSVLTETHVKNFVTEDSLALELDPETVALSINESWLESAFPKISKGDRVNVLVSNPQRGIEDTVFLTKNTEVIDVVTSKSSNSHIAVKVTEEEAKNMLFARSQELLFIVTLSQ